MPGLIVRPIETPVGGTHDIVSRSPIAVFNPEIGGSVRSKNPQGDSRQYRETEHDSEKG